MKTPKDIAIMLGALSFIRVDGLTIWGYFRSYRNCAASKSLNGIWGITKEGFLVAITRDGDMWVRWNQDLPDMTDSTRICMCECLFEKMDCSRSSLADNITVLRVFEQFDTHQLLSRINNPEWEPSM